MSCIHYYGANKEAFSDDTKCLFVTAFVRCICQSRLELSTLQMLIRGSVKTIHVQAYFPEQLLGNFERFHMRAD